MPEGGIRDTFSKIRHRKPQPVFCPRCGSADLKRVANFGILPPKWRCEKCGYEGIIVLELEPDNLEGREPL